MRRLVQAHALAAVVIAAGSVAANAQIDVELELVLAVDVSHSMDYQEQQLQRDGYVAAFRDPEVRRAIALGPRGRIAVTYLEWSGTGTQHVVMPWTLIDSAAAAEGFAVRLATQSIGRGHTTSISGALAFSVRHFEQSPFRGARRVIDISGDGPNNRGRPLALARAEALAQGIVINGLPILNDRPQPWTLPTPIEFGLDRYYAEQVIGGPGSFTVVAEDFTAFREAVLTKLILEIAGIEGAPARIAGR